jgi:quinol monooxygenase YgiN
MSEPVFFISHFAIKEGAVDELRRFTAEGTERLREEKPGTVLFLSYLDEQAGRISFLHAFPDADAMDRHFEGADERAAAAYEFIEPRGWEFYGRPNEQAMESMRRAAEHAGVSLVVEPEFVGGFLRLQPS